MLKSGLITTLSMVARNALSNLPMCAPLKTPSQKPNVAKVFVITQIQSSVGWIRQLATWTTVTSVDYCVVLPCWNFFAGRKAPSVRLISGVCTFSLCQLIRVMCRKWYNYSSLSSGRKIHDLYRSPYNYNPTPTCLHFIPKFYQVDVRQAIVNHTSS